MISHEISRWDILSHLTCVRSFRIKWICSAWKILILGKGCCCLQNIHRQLHLGLWQRQKGMKTRSGSSSTVRYKVMKFVTFNTPLHNLGPSKYTKVRKFATAVLTFISYFTGSIQNYHISFDNWKMQRIQATVSYNCHLPYYPVDQEFLIKQKLSLYSQSFDQSLEWGQW